MILPYEGLRLGNRNKTGRMPFTGLTAFGGFLTCAQGHAQ
jgi:hypothetical protein